MVTEEKQVLIDVVIENLKEDIKQGDFTVLDELLGFVPTKHLIHSLPEKLWVKFTPPKFVPYIEEKTIVHANGITEHVRKNYRTRTKYDWMPTKISHGNFIVEYQSTFDRFNNSYWGNDGYLANVLIGNIDKPMEYHYGNDSHFFLFNLLRHFPTKELLLENIDKWANYYRKHVTDTLSTYSTNDLHLDVFAQRMGLRNGGIKQEFTNHTLEEIENSDVREYYKFKYKIFDDHIDFYNNPVYQDWVTIKIYFK